MIKCLKLREMESEFKQKVFEQLQRNENKVEEMWRLLSKCLGKIAQNCLTLQFNHI